MSEASASPPTILDAFKATRNLLSERLRTRRYTVKSCGTKDLSLAEPVSSVTGYWTTPSHVSSKPPRWILHIAADHNGAVEAGFPLELATSQPVPGARTVGYINNRDGSCVSVVLRIHGAVKAPGVGFSLPDWEWLLLLAFDRPLAAGTSGDALTNIDLAGRRIDCGVGNRQVNVALLALIKSPHPTILQDLQTGISYDQGTQAIAEFLGSSGGAVEVFDSASPESLENLADIVQALYTYGRGDAPPTVILPSTSLLGIGDETYEQINAALAGGKRHFIFYGPPGTGKTTLAEYCARQLAKNEDEVDPYVLLTASAAWSSQDLVGGYQPLGPGSIGFVPGVMLRDFDKPIVIDELNRCPIDAVVGPLFSVLSGQASTLPYREHVAEAGSPFYVILPEEKSDKSSVEFAPGPYWRLICTLNTYDKTQLGQVSYALSRRFAWIRVGVPKDVDAFVCQMARSVGLEVGEGRHRNLCSEMWTIVNNMRQIGGAPIIDFLRAAAAMEPGVDLFVAPEPRARQILMSCFGMFVLPLLDGISRQEAENCARLLSEAWGLNDGEARRFEEAFADFAL